MRLAGLRVIMQSGVRQGQRGRTGLNTGSRSFRSAIRAIWGRRHGHGVEPAGGGDDQPLRAELLSLEQLKEHAKALAAKHAVDEKRGPDLLLPQLSENECVLLNAYRLIADEGEGELRVTPAAEWLRDNFYLIEEQIRAARRHLPKGYSQELPRLLSGPSAGYPVVYDIALELVSHGDGRVDAGSLSAFVSRLPDRQAAQAGRALGDPDHAAPGADQQPPSRRGAHRCRPARAQPGEPLGRPDDRGGGEGADEPDPHARGHGAVGPADVQRLRSRTRAPAPGPGARAGHAAHLAGAAAHRDEPDDRAAGPA